VSRAWRWLPALGWAAIIFVLSSQPKLPELPLRFEGQDKLLHAGTFGVLALLCSYGLAFPLGRRALLAAAIAVVYGASDELHQAFVPGRSADVLDLVADAAGGLFAVAVLERWRRPRQETSS
jgi:VanZ family protein